LRGPIECHGRARHQICTLIHQTPETYFTFGAGIAQYGVNTPYRYPAPLPIVDRTRHQRRPDK
jgi:hypothetical protein